MQPRARQTAKTAYYGIGVSVWLLIGLNLMAGLLDGLNGAALAHESVQYETEASWYSIEACEVNPDKRCPTASGISLYKLEADGVLFAADWIHRFGQRLKVTNLANGRSVEVAVLDRGPNRRLVGRNIDLGLLAYSKIADPKGGVINVLVEEIDMEGIK